MPCADCGRILVGHRLWAKLPKSIRQALKATHAKAQSHGLCGACTERHRKAGTLINFDPRRLSHQDILEEYAILSRLGEGFTDAQIADRLGISAVTLWRHLKKRDS